MAEWSNTGRETLETILEKVWKQKNPALLKDIYWPDACIEGLLPDAQLTVDEFVDMVSQFLVLVDVLEWRIVYDFCGADNHHYARAQVKIRMKSNEKTGSFLITNVFRMREDRPEHAHIMMDGLTFLERVGALPQGALYIAMAGESFS